MPQAPLRRDSRPQRPARQRPQRPTAAARGYGHKWRAYRERFLAANPLCCQCHAAGVTRPAAHVDHITPVASASDPLFWKPSNHQPLCHPCHSRKTATEPAGRRPTRPTRPGNPTPPGGERIAGPDRT